MAISQFPAPSAGGITNDFILDKNGTENTTFELGRDFASGGYSVVVTGSTAYDIYLLDSDGSAVGYTNGDSIVASDRFISASVLGLGTADSVAFTFGGPSTNASSIGTEPGAGAFLVSVTPSDLPEIDDTAVVAGGNFASDVEFSFISGTVVLPAKNVVVGSSTAAVVTRPDSLIEDLAPYDLQAINPGVTVPTGSDANVLSGTVTAGTDPSFITTSPILGAFPDTAYSSAILASDAEGTVVNWQVTAGAIPTGLTLGTADGSLAGTPTVAGSFDFTVQITDNGGNTNSRAFIMPVGLLIEGTNANSTVVGGTTYVYWTDTGDLQYSNASSSDAEYIVIAGGGGGGHFNNGASSSSIGGGAGAGGLLFGTATFTGAGTATVTVGAGGAKGPSGSNGTQGSNSVLTGYATATGGGFGARAFNPGGSGGSGGGGGQSSTPGTGIAGQGNDGLLKAGGGAGGVPSGVNQSGGLGADFGAWASAIDIIYTNGLFAGGGASYDSMPGGSATGGGGTLSGDGSVNSGGGGGGGSFEATDTTPGNGGSGLVIVRYS